MSLLNHFHSFGMLETDDYFVMGTGIINLDQINISEVKI